MSDPLSPSVSAEPHASEEVQLTGEALFAKARDLPHREIPDLDRDASYLKLLGQSAAKGYPPALAKLGEYAMRRCAWVEAYYWMKQARRYGMRGLSTTLLHIRNEWALDGFPDQVSNFNEIFTQEAGSLGRALLHVDSGHKAFAARAFLKTNYPDYL